MALMYTPAKVSFLTAGIDLSSATIKAVLLKSSYTPVATDQFRSAITAGAEVGTAQALGSKTTTSGVFDAADITFTAVGTTTACDKVLIYKDTGSAATDNLIAVVDLSSAVTPNGGDIAVTWDNGASKIFRLN